MGFSAKFLIKKKKVVKNGNHCLDVQSGITCDEVLKTGPFQIVKFDIFWEGRTFLFSPIISSFLHY